MRFSKRPQPMDFGRAEADGAAEAEVEAIAEVRPVGFRPLDHAPLDHAPMDDLARHAPALHPDRPAPAERAAFVEARLAELAHGPPAAWPVWLAAGVVALLWAAAPIAFALGYRSQVTPFAYEPFAMAVLALLSIGPAAFVLLAAYMIRQAQRLAYESRRGRAMAEDMLTPSLIAAARAGDVAQAVREEIARAGSAADEARETLMALRDALAFETDKLTGATAQSVRTANELAGTLGRERSEMSALAHTLDAQAMRVTDAITQQARMVAEATGVAETQIREAEAGLSARAAELAAAAGEASTAARTAGEDLTRHIARLETAGAGVAEQVKSVESGLSEQRAALAMLSRALKVDHEHFAAQAEAHGAQLEAFIAAARESAEVMSGSAAAGGEQLRRLMADAALQFRDLAETARAEREEFGQSTLQSLEAVSHAAADQRAQLEAQTRAAIEALARAAEDTRAAAARHAAAAREQVDALSEAAFGAGQKANQVFEARLEEARALIAQSSKLVEDAGAVTARRLDEGVAAARRAMDELTAMLAELETRALHLPAAAADQAQQVRAAVVDGVDELVAQARRTAAEAQAIDAAFQDRVRRNFEMLSEAVRLMGAATVTPPLAAPNVPPSPQPAAVEAPPVVREARPTTPEPLAAATAEPRPVSDAGGELADRIGLRNRIRFTPTATDREFSAVFEAASGVSPPATLPTAPEEAEEAGETWTWKDLLASLDGADGEAERLEETLARELASMGVDPAKLLPAGQIEELAADWQAGDVARARETVRQLAPAATRRISRRLFTDEDIKRQTEVYLRRFRLLIDDAVQRDPRGLALASLLDGEGGRTFLILDAAAGETR